MLAILPVRQDYPSRGHGLHPMTALHCAQDEKGTTLIEAAAILPILFWLTFGIIDFGRYLYVASAVHAAAQEGARAGLGQDGIVDLAGAARAAKANLAMLDTTTVTIKTEQPTLEIVEVQVIYHFEFITPLLAALYPGNQLEIDGIASMIIF